MGEYRTERKGILPSSKESRWRRKRRIGLGLLVLAAGLIAAALWVRVEGTVSALGFVASEEHAEVRSPVPGMVVGIKVRTGDLVQPGDLLVRLDQREAEATLDEARSQYRKAQAELLLRRAQLRETGRLHAAEIRAGEMRLEHAVNRLERMRELQARGLAAGATLADAKHQAELLAAELEKLRARDAELADREIEVLERELEARRDAVALATNRLRSLEIRAPIAGQVLRYEFVAGEIVRSDAVLLEIFGGQRQVLKLRISERHAMRVQPGDRYEARLGAYRGAVFHGVVKRLRNVIQEADRHPYRAAYCSFDAGDRDVPPGTSAEARIYTGKQPLWRWLLGWR